MARTLHCGQGVHKVNGRILRRPREPLKAGEGLEWKDAERV